MISKKPLFKIKVRKTHSSRNEQTPNKHTIGKTCFTTIFQKNYSTSTIAPNVAIINAIIWEKSRTLLKTFTYEKINNNLASINMEVYKSVNGKETNITKVRKTIKTPYDICWKRKINSFMAFRAFYSQFAQGIKQEKLSAILSKEWKSGTIQQQFWLQLTDTCKDTLI